MSRGRLTLTSSDSRITARFPPLTYNPAMRPRTVCVLGGSGFVGSHLCPALAGAGHRVTVLSRDPERARHLRVVPAIRVLRCNVHDPM